MSGYGLTCPACAIGRETLYLRTAKPLKGRRRLYEQKIVRQYQCIACGYLLRTVEAILGGERGKAGAKA